MAGMLGFLVAGAAEGWSDQQLAASKQAREERLKELDNQRADRRALDSDTRQAAENQKGRDATATENALNRKTQLDIASIRTDNNSTNVADANWLVKIGAAPDLKAAYEKVTSAAGDKTARSRMIIDVAKTMAGNSEPIPGNDNPTFADYQAAATTQVDALIQSTGSGGGADSGSTAPSKRSTYEDAGGPAGQVPPAANRVVGKIYTNSQGKMARWAKAPDGSMGWEPVK